MTWCAIMLMIFFISNVLQIPLVSNPPVDAIHSSHRVDDHSVHCCGYCIRQESTKAMVAIARLRAEMNEQRAKRELQSLKL